ncbi:TonB-dependent receptor, partial [Mycobacterium tuberculosis]
APNTASNAGEIFSPYKSKQYEVGAKFDLDGTMATVSAFQITKPSGQLTGNLYAADSEQRNRGLEFNVFG